MQKEAINVSLSHSIDARPSRGLYGERSVWYNAGCDRCEFRTFQCVLERIRTETVSPSVRPITALSSNILYQLHRPTVTSSSVSTENINFLWNRTHNRPPSVSMLSQFNPVHTPFHYLLLYFRSGFFHSFRLHHRNPIRATRPAYLILLHLVTRIIFVEQHKSLCSFIPRSATCFHSAPYSLTPSGCYRKLM